MSKLTVVLMLFVAGGCMTSNGDLFVCFRVRDTDGNPVTNAVVTANALAVCHINAGMWDSDYRWYNVEADARGQAEFRVRTQDTYIGWSVKADGFYGTEWAKLSFTGKGGEKEGRSKDAPKIVNVSLYRKRSPIPAYAFYAYCSIRTPKPMGEFGFDLMVGDWLPPFGKGEVADFYLVKKNIHDGKRQGVYKFFRFDEGCGFRRYKKTPNKEFPTTYIALTNEFYDSELHYMEVADNSDAEVRCARPVAEDEFLVLRTRAKINEKGEVVSANYSKLYGPVEVGRCFQVMQSVFNPTANDPNLEFDPQRNLNRKYLGCGLRP